MSDGFDKSEHSVRIHNREEMTLEGIKQVGGFNEQEVSASCDWGGILIRGSALHIEVLDVEAGVLKISGRITALVYQDSVAGKGFFRRLLS